MSKATVIYGLVDPVTGQLRYVGKTCTGFGRRLDAHIADARRGVQRPCAFWINSLLKRGLRPEMFEIEVCAPGADWEDAEQFYIEYFRAIGFRLLNISVGGGAGSLGWKANVETKNKMSLAKLGRSISDDTKKKIGIANMGRAQTDRQRLLNSNAHRGEKSAKAKITEADVPIIRGLFAAGYSGTQVGSVFGITKQAADAIRHKAAWSHVPDIDADISSICVPPIRRLRGDKVGTSKLSEIAVREIRRRLAGPQRGRETGKALAAEYGVSTTVISDVKNRRIWQHVD